MKSMTINESLTTIYEHLRKSMKINENEMEMYEYR